MLKGRFSIGTQFLVLLTLVLALNGAAYFLMLKNVYMQELRAQAQIVVANVEAFGSWVAKNGRVWVKDNSDSYLGHVALQSLDEPSETVHFYSKNPALAQREFSETVAASASPAKFRMTSSNVMNPANRPDAFETRALDAIDRDGLAEYFETVGRQYRYAKPVFHTESCIACHGKASTAPDDVLEVYGSQNGFGFEVGDVAGVISVTIPQRNVLSGAVSVFGLIEVIAIALSVLGILWFVRRKVIRPVHQLTQVANQISRGETAELDVTDISLNSRNEIDQLKLATSRMKNSFAISMRKMKEARSTAQKAVKVARTLQAKQQDKDD